MPKRGLSPTSWKKSNIKQETTMRNIILALVGAALLAGPASQVAFEGTSSRPPREAVQY